ncbi:Homocysteine S-methyltransferase [Podospora didyma]|uniref:Homocysteine S-methyltransferase n=1 Tax=Podospora didyma TaxID=330526 RepID=A0AAE0P4T7_9PEZI|nr:Homocysteine S-methyltransferase [Podospora didyma]
MKDLTPVLILDGGLGTTLEDKYHVDFSSDKTPLWSSHLLVSDQATLLACQSEFANAGADVILTATYQVSIEGFAATKTPEWPRGISIANIGQFLEDAVLIASQAAPPESQIALSLGPYGATMIPSTEYSGVYDDEGVRNLSSWHYQRLMLFAKVPKLLSRINLVALETIPRIDEIIVVRKMISEQRSRFSGSSGDKIIGKLPQNCLPMWISCVYPGEDERLPDGGSVEDAVAAMLSSEVSAYVPWGIGINCTKVGKLASLVKRYEKAVQGLIDTNILVDWPSLVLYPDGTNGEVYNTTTKTWELPEGRKAPEVPWEIQLAEVVNATMSRGEWRSILVGGCCKSTPSDIKRLRELFPVAQDGLSDADTQDERIHDGLGSGSG